MRTQVEEDAFKAWTYALNCPLSENDPGPAELNTGTADEPRMVPRSQAWQHLYALLVLIHCEADHARLMAAARQCRAEVADPRARLWEERIAELSRAAGPVRASGEDGGGRRSCQRRQGAAPPARRL
jgi:hypothetical protein